MGDGWSGHLSSIAFIAMLVVSGLPVAAGIAPDGCGAFKPAHLIDGAEFLVFGFFLEACFIEIEACFIERA